MLIPASIQQMVKSFGGTIDIDINGKPNRGCPFLDANIAAPTGMLWAETMTHDLSCCVVPDESPTTARYWARIEQDVRVGVVACDDGLSAGTQDDSGKCERCNSTD